MQFADLFNHSYKSRKPIMKEGNISYKMFKKYFSEDPVSFLFNNYSSIVNEVSSYSTLKLRAPITNSNELFRLSRILPIFSDHIVFSPAPLWPGGCHIDIEKPWTEFSLYNYNYGGHLNFVPFLGEFYTWLISVKPLIESGNIIYLPHMGSSLHEWNYPDFNLPQLPEELTRNLLDKKIILKNALLRILLENYISYKLGCIHILPSMTKEKLAIYDLFDDAHIKQDAQKSYALLNLKIPFLEKIDFHTLAKIKHDEYESFISFRKSVLSAVDQITNNAIDGSQIDKLVIEIQHDIIDEPLRILESKLKRISNYYFIRMAGYTISSIMLFLPVILGNGIFSTLAGTFGVVNVLNIYDTLVDCLEKYGSLSHESVFYLSKIIRNKS